MASKAEAPTRGGDSEAPASAREAWALLARLVYSGPPPFIEAARKMDLRPPAFGTLRALDQPKTMSEIAAALHCDNSNVTGIVDGLEERGLVTRTASESDRRVKLIALTPSGRRIRSRLMETISEPPAWLSKLSAAEQRQLRDLLRRVVE